MPRNSLIQFRKDIGTPASGVLVEGEGGYGTDIKRFYIGTTTYPKTIGPYRSVVDVRDYGAVSGTASAAQILAAQADSNTEGVPMFLPKGTWTMPASSLPLDQNLWIVGEERTLSTLSLTGFSGTTNIEGDLRVENCYINMPQMIWLNLIMRNARLNCFINSHSYRRGVVAYNSEFNMFPNIRPTTADPGPIVCEFYNCQLGSGISGVRPGLLAGTVIKVVLQACSLIGVGTDVQQICAYTAPTADNLTGEIHYTMKACVCMTNVAQTFLSSGVGTTTGGNIDTYYYLDCQILGSAAPVTYDLSATDQQTIRRFTILSNCAVDPTSISARLTAATGTLNGTDGLWFNNRQL